MRNHGVAALFCAWTSVLHYYCFACSRTSGWPCRTRKRSKVQGRYNCPECLTSARPEQNRVLSLAAKQRCFKPAASSHATYFEVWYCSSSRSAQSLQLLNIDPFSIRLSVYTTDNLEPELQHVKQHSPLSMLVGFENADIGMDKFHFERPSAKLHVLLECLQQFYGQQFLSQAYKILGCSSSNTHAAHRRRRR